MTPELVPITGPEGFASFAGSGSGWHQLATPAATLPVLPIPVPDGAVAAAITTTAELRWAMAPVAVQETPDLAPIAYGSGTTFKLFNAAQLAALCVQLTGSPTAFSIQFYRSV